MWNPSDRKSSLAGAALKALALALLLAAAPAWPQGASKPAPAAPLSAERQALQKTLTEGYEAEAISGGVRLTPRKDRLGVRTLEMTGEGIKVNGARIAPDVLTAWLGDDARPLVTLAGLPAAERRAVLGLPADAGPAALPAGKAAPEPIAKPAEPTDEAATDSDLAAEEPETSDTPEEPATPPSPHSVSSGSKVRFGGGVTVEADEVAETAVSIGGRVRVDGEVRENVAAIGGPVEINGKVGGDVVSVGSNVTLGPKSEVGGDVASVGGVIERAPGAKVHGSMSENAGGVWHGIPWHIDSEGARWHPFGRFVEFSWSVFGKVILALLACLILLLARQPFERVDRQLAADFWKSAIAGLAGEILFIPLFVVVTLILAISIIGCVLFLLYPFVFLALLFFSLLGYTASAHQLGRLLENRFGRRFGSPYAATLVGVAAIEIWTVLGYAINLGGGVLHVLAALFIFFGILVRYVAWTAGLGAVILSRFGLPPKAPAGVYPPVAPPPPAPESLATPAAPTSAPGWPEDPPVEPA